MSYRVMIVRVRQQRPELLLGKIALLGSLSIHPKNKFTMPEKEKINQLLACSGMRRRRNSSGAPANS